MRARSDVDSFATAEAARVPITNVLRPASNLRRDLHPYDWSEKPADYCYPTETRGTERVYGVSDGTCTRTTGLRNQPTNCYLQRHEARECGQVWRWMALGSAGALTASRDLATARFTAVGTQWAVTEVELELPRDSLLLRRQRRRWVATLGPL